MKFLIRISLLTLLLSSCANPNYHYQSEQAPQKLIGQNVSVLQQQWGSADQVFHTRSGTSYYVYTTSAANNFFNTTVTNASLIGENEDFPLRGQQGLKCSAIFKTNINNIIISATHMGSNCGGEWAPNK